MKPKAALHIVVDREGIQKIQIFGPSEVHREGHDMYFKIRHLLPQFDREIQKVLGNNGATEVKETY